MHADLVKFYANTQFVIVSPICPHICEHVWSLLGNKTLIVNEKWPVFEPVDYNLTKEFDFILTTIHDFRQKVIDFLIFVASILASSEYEAKERTCSAAPI